MDPAFVHEKWTDFVLEKVCKVVSKGIKKTEFYCHQTIMIVSKQSQCSQHRLVTISSAHKE